MCFEVPSRVPFKPQGPPDTFFQKNHAKVVDTRSAMYALVLFIEFSWILVKLRAKRERNECAEWDLIGVRETFVSRYDQISSLICLAFIESEL